MAQRHFSTIAVTLAGLLIFSAASLAEDNSNHGDTDTVVADTAGSHRDLAKKAIIAATLQAIESVNTYNKLDLDIRLIGPTSVKIASKR